MSTLEGAHWLALLNAPGLRRSAAKQTLFHWCVLQGKPAAALTDADAAALAELGLDQPQQQLLRSALTGAKEHASTLNALLVHDIHLLTRADTAYPELLPQRLPEDRLPYTLYYRGNLELLCLPGIAVTGALQPSDACRAFTRELTTGLSSAENALLSGYQKGTERAAVEMTVQSGGSAVLVLPLGLHANASLLADLEAPFSTGRLLVLSPYACGTPYTEALGRARLPLVSALCDMLLALEPDQPPTAWLDGLQPPLPALAAWRGAAAEPYEGWLKSGSSVISSAEQALSVWHDTCDGAPCAENSTPEPCAYDDTPIVFQDADSAIETLSRSGNVPDVLARRLRERAAGWGM